VQFEWLWDNDLKRAEDDPSFLILQPYNHQWCRAIARFPLIVACRHVETPASTHTRAGAPATVLLDGGVIPSRARLGTVPGLAAVAAGSAGGSEGQAVSFGTVLAVDRAMADERGSPVLAPLSSSRRIDQA